MKRVLVVHPDLMLTEKVIFVLQHSGFQVVSIKDGHQAIAEIMAECSHRLNGEELCPRIREACRAPIIILGQAQEEAAGIEMLEMGADVYLTSPLNLRELLARVRSLLRGTQTNVTELEGE
jgi:two-component system response regulator CpxR